MKTAGYKELVKLYKKGIRNFSCVDLSNADLKGINLSNTDLSFANLSNANLSDADLSDADLSGANLSGANLTNANLIGVNLINTNLTRVNLSNAKGIGTREEEIKFAQGLLDLFKSETGKLEMSRCCTCDTTLCIAEWAFPDNPNAMQLTCLKYPTLSRYLWSSNEQAMEALKRVASGKESVF